MQHAGSTHRSLECVASDNYAIQCVQACTPPCTPSEPTNHCARRVRLGARRVSHVADMSSSACDYSVAPSCTYSPFHLQRIANPVRHPPFICCWHRAPVFKSSSLNPTGVEAWDVSRVTSMSYSEFKPPPASPTTAHSMLATQAGMGTAMASPRAACAACVAPLLGDTSAAQLDPLHSQQPPHMRGRAGMSVL